MGRNAVEGEHLSAFRQLFTFPFSFFTDRPAQNVLRDNAALYRARRADGAFANVVRENGSHLTEVPSRKQLAQNPALRG